MSLPFSMSDLSWALFEVVGAILAVVIGVGLIYFAFIIGLFAYYARQQRIRVSGRDDDRARAA